MVDTTIKKVNNVLFSDVVEVIVKKTKTLSI